MATLGPVLPGTTDSSDTKAVASERFLNSCRNVEELERLTSQYAMMCKLLRGLPEEPCDTNMAAKLKNEMVEIDAALESLTNATLEAEQLKAEIRTIMDEIKEHIRQNMDNFILNSSLQSLKQASSSVRRTGTPSKRLGESIDDPVPDPEKQPSAREGRMISADVDKENHEDRGTSINQNKESRSTIVSAQEFRGVPEHLRGRLTVGKVNETLEMLRNVTHLKYRLLKKGKGLTMTEKEAVVRMRSENVPALGDSRFITEADIFLFKRMRLTRATLSHLVVLRHLQRTCEVRDRNILRIILKS